MNLVENIEQAICNLEYARCKAYLHVRGVEPLLCGAFTGGRGCVLDVLHHGDHESARGEHWSAAACPVCGSEEGEPCKTVAFYAFGQAPIRPHDRKQEAVKRRVFRDMCERMREAKASEA